MTHVNVGHISPQKPMTVTKLIDLWASKFPKLGALRLEWAPFYASDGMNLVEYRVIAQAKGLSPDLRWVSKICIDLHYPRPVTALKSGPEMPWTVWQGHSMRWEKTATALSALRPVSRLGHSFLADRSRKSVRFKLFFFQTWWISQEMMKFKFSKFNFSILFITKWWSSTWFPHIFPGGRVFHLRWPPSHRDCDGDRLSDLRHRGAARTKRNRTGCRTSLRWGDVSPAQCHLLQDAARCCKFMG